MLDALDTSPAFIKTATWDIVAWNRAAAAVLTDYDKRPREERNILRLMFGNSRLRDIQEDWEAVARYVLGSFRAVARAGATKEITQLVDELSHASADFERLWRDNEIAEHHHEGLKRLHHPEVGLFELEFSAFAIDGRPELGMMIYNPASNEDSERVRLLIDALDR